MGVQGASKLSQSKMSKDRNLEKTHIWPGRWTGGTSPKGIKALMLPLLTRGSRQCKPWGVSTAMTPGTSCIWAACQTQLGSPGGERWGPRFDVGTPFKTAQMRAQEKPAEEIKTTHKAPSTKPRLAKAGISCYLSRQQLLAHKDQAPTPAGCVA